jgi:hypothetical protein
MPISGKEMVKRFEKAGWVVLRKRGSHVEVVMLLLGKTVIGKQFPCMMNSAKDWKDLSSNDYVEVNNDGLSF